MLLVNKTNNFTDSVLYKGIINYDNYLSSPINVKKLYLLLKGDYYNIREFIDVLCFLLLLGKIKLDYKGEEIYVSRA